MFFAYEDMINGQTAQKAYRKFFDLLLTNDKDKNALLFHCTAGKDRTGFGALLILSALGVPFTTIRYDYTLTNITTKSFVDARGELGAEAHYYSHDSVGAWDILCASRSFIDMDDCLKCAQLVGLHMKMYQEVWYDRMYTHFFLKGSAESIELWRALHTLHMCDKEAH